MNYIAGIIKSGVMIILISGFVTLFIVMAIPVVSNIRSEVAIQSFYGPIFLIVFFLLSISFVWDFFKSDKA